MAEYIPREAVMEAVDNADVMCDIHPDAYRVLRRYIERIPAADVVPVRHGKWIKYAPHNSDMMTCSECEKYWILDGDQYDFRYCPPLRRENGR